MQGNIRSVVSVCLCFAGALYGETYYVALPPAGLDANDGLGWGSPMATISNALSKTDVNLVLISNGTYNITATITNKQAVIIRGVNTLGQTNTIIDGGGALGCFVLDHPRAMLDGLVITNGRASSGGGVAIFGNGGIVTNCLITGNECVGNQSFHGGGGIWIYGTGAVYNSRIIGNRVPVDTTPYPRGGGIFMYTGPSTNYTVGGLVENCLIAENICTNSSHGGGGIFVAKIGIVRNCVISNNQAKYGGGVSMDRGGTLDKCDIINNDGQEGCGGSYIFVSSPDTIGVLLKDCLICNNTASKATAYGGGLYITGDTNHAVRGCTIASNTAGYAAGGVFITAGVVEDCLIASNTCFGADAGGGGIYAAASSTNQVYIRNAVIVSNLGYSSPAWGGGGIFLSNARMENSDILYNSSSNGGGGGIGAAKTSIVANCRIIGNVATERGGGVKITGESSLHNCLVAGNLCKGLFGGGIYANNNAAGMISGCTVVDNEVQGTAAYQRGAGIAVSSSNNIYNCLVYSNRWTGSAPDQERDLGMYPWGDLEAQSNSVYYCCSPRNFNGVSGNITNPPSFVGITDGNWRLTAGSAGINAGTNQFWMLAADAADLDGHPRLDRFTGLADMGCYEYVFPGTIFRFK